jgi:hypothetical protein
MNIQPQRVTPAVHRTVLSRQRRTESLVLGAAQPAPVTFRTLVVPRVSCEPPQYDTALHDRATPRLLDSAESRQYVR